MAKSVKDPKQTKVSDSLLGHYKDKQQCHHPHKKQTLKSILLEVNKKYVNIGKRERLKNNAILHSVLEDFLKRMKSCSMIFKNMKPRLEYIGSYFDRLRVAHATEYDINIVLTLPLNYDKILLDSKNVVGAYTTINMPSEFRRLSKTAVMVDKGFKDTELWCDPQHRLSVKKIRSWMQSVVDATLSSLLLENGSRVIKVNNKTYQIAAKTSGPANTLSITESSENVIDVDLVPTLEFKYPKIPECSQIDFNKILPSKKKKYFAVPKPCSNDYSWRLAFPFQERYYMFNKKNMKSTIKIIKLLRDAQGFHKLASYYIKTIFLWEALENTNEFWIKNSLPYLVVHMMKKLKECLEKGEIKNFWCPYQNLIETIKPETCQNWANRLTHIIDVVEEKKNKNPQVILQYLKPPHIK